MPARANMAIMPMKAKVVASAFTGMRRNIAAPLMRERAAKVAERMRASMSVPLVEVAVFMLLLYTAGGNRSSDFPY